MSENNFFNKNFIPEPVETKKTQKQYIVKKKKKMAI